MLLSQSKNVGFNRQLNTTRHVWPVNIMDNWDMDIEFDRNGGGAVGISVRKMSNRLGDELFFTYADQTISGIKE